MERAPVEFINRLVSILSLYKEKPYLQYWGELFCITLELDKYAKNIQKDIHFFDSYDSSPVIYLFEKKTFLV